ncbi:MAG: DUF1802 family protein [Tepidisphaeraceae bacterium]|jgi:hypothetical protein
MTTADKPAEKLSVGLKEWDIVCRAMESGRQMLLLRKGGIYEAAGEFELEHRRFLLFPTFLHQNLAMLKPAAQGGFTAVSAEPSAVRLSAAAEVTDIIPLTSRPAMDSLDDEHVWTKPLIDMRFNYKPQNPLYLLLLRVYRLSVPRTIANTPAYAGCKSWVPLDAPLETTGAAAVMDDSAYQNRRRNILDRLGQSALNRGA